ncbi:bifunctional folylpolyglutamate synthase/dihydrofolate synthase [Candidatus Magnetominusculus xianensis]|uniref:Dihydrofolate synthase/folylpolyglutamate synthase n=1 Tax=Candidatus Magnetominusculus xianensis TaxID=1748249 RepID=A0ABR5SBQ9_9BACT|nr:folylpolyglutamate synthase/dihydrofolate synthase family protein [Candidatus Magnetominusculus xianensis]KWT78222.1 folylpolyglutamate synthase [Candidatus Magnetominusculus xianensis]MBF0402826.1 bifunctional folylpolyglutamate synthase/dihydrofolate synthase [Nitrospirota bacterium]
MPDHRYERAVSYLYSLQKHGIKLGLTNITHISNLLGAPQSAYKSIHVAGTNGKGSTCAMLQGILMERGYKTGLFTSPHMVRFTERIKVDGVEILPETVVELTEEINHAIRGADTLNPTFFEFVTAIAFLYFKRQDVDWVVFETGMGGRFDATNIIKPEASVITNIDMDHMEFLGNTIEEIAGEKAGIIKQDTPVVTTSQAPRALGVLRQKAAEQNARLEQFGVDFDAHLIRHDITGIEFNYCGSGGLSTLKIPFTGVHQVENAACAARTAEILFNGTQGLESALRGIKWPGRCELIKYAGVDMLLDGAHNPAAAEALSQTLQGIYVQSFPAIILIIGAMADKDTAGMLRALMPAADTVILSTPSYERAARPERLLELARAHSTLRHTLYSAPSISEAIKLAGQIYKKGSLVVITGSFYTVGEAKEAMGEPALLKTLAEFK